MTDQTRQAESDAVALADALYQRTAERDLLAGELLFAKEQWEYYRDKTSEFMGVNQRLAARLRVLAALDQRLHELIMELRWVHGTMSDSDKPLDRQAKDALTAIIRRLEGQP